MTDWFLDRIAARADRPAFVSDAERVSYRALARDVGAWAGRLDAAGIGPGEAVVVLGDHSATCFALLIALAARKAIVIPLTAMPESVLAERCHTAAAAWVIDCLDPAGPRFERRRPQLAPPLYGEIRGRGHSGLILFSSGSSSEPKACLLDLDLLIGRVRQERRGLVTLTFLLFDHIGGLNTLINVLGHGGTAVVPGGRDVETVARAIAAHGVELLPTSPTFLKMLLISDAAARHDLSSLKLITYGTEVMPDSTLADLHRAFPEVALKQTYGLSEIGIVPTRSRAPGSPWMQVGGGDVETKIVDGILWLRAPTAMLGYLNAPSPIDAAGWLNTGDKVLVDGDWLRILGRESELINVGGVKVHPSEVESVLLAAGNILDATVSARASPVTGSLVVATVVLAGPEEPAALRARLDRHCRERLEPCKVPAAYRISEVPLHSGRFKKARARA